MNPQNTPEPHPEPKATDPRQSAHWLVCADLMDRAALGQQKYGVPLLADNGRDHLRDAYQELLDLAAYLRMELEQQQAEEVPIPYEVATLAPNTTQPHSMTLDEMATILTSNSYYVCKGPIDEHTWQYIGKDQGYVQELGMDEEEWENIGKHHGYGPYKRGVG